MQASFQRSSACALERVHHMCNPFELSLRLQHSASVRRKLSEQRVELARMAEGHMSATPLREAIKQLVQVRHRLALMLVCRFPMSDLTLSAAVAGHLARGAARQLGGIRGRCCSNGGSRQSGGGGCGCSCSLLSNARAGIGSSSRTGRHFPYRTPSSRAHRG